ncbi:autotransporter outer membrane beta-barrel domain-containing protein [Candidatus Tisiphia endosymbiont of Nemotelus uliginosus]|uniref:autotransporter outer membrane beta-barrel domain-containing protein n=1 Tax=Candidatus Tisiphia endosymbiont of Nemotelus uliginosus TaxID=3077926 RepID=UPI0035C8B57E
MRRLQNSVEPLVTLRLEQDIFKINQALIFRISQIKLNEMEGIIALSAGDDTNKIPAGSWATSFYEQAEQKKQDGVAGYKAKTFGGILGIDIEVNDNLTAGVAWSKIETNMKYKDYKAGDKTQTNTTIFSLYGSQQLNSTLFVQAIASYASTQVKNQEHRLGYSKINSAGAQIAQSNYNSTTLAGKILFGYDANLTDKILLTPIIGIDYIQSREEAHQESGTADQNKLVASKNSRRTDAIIGARILTTTNINTTNILFDAHTFVSHKIGSKLGLMNARFDISNAPVISRAAKNVKTLYNVGVGFSTVASFIEYGAYYDSYFFAKKYIAHQGSLKLRVNF